tara:strand:+ start:69 stop:1181 length:1113 start_codon:yes stop_codon:yes gene_type:complete
MDLIHDEDFLMPHIPLSSNDTDDYECSFEGKKHSGFTGGGVPISVSEPYFPFANVASNTSHTQNTNDFLCLIADAGNTKCSITLRNKKQSMTPKGMFIGGSKDDVGNPAFRNSGVPYEFSVDARLDGGAWDRLLDVVGSDIDGLPASRARGNNGNNFSGKAFVNSFVVARQQHFVDNTSPPPTGTPNFTGVDVPRGDLAPRIYDSSADASTNTNKQAYRGVIYFPITSTGVYNEFRINMDTSKCYLDDSLAKLYEAGFYGRTPRRFKLFSAIQSSMNSLGRSTSSGTFTGAEVSQFKVGVNRSKMIEYSEVQAGSQILTDLDTFITEGGHGIIVKMYMTQGLNFGLTIDEAYEYYLDNHTGKPAHTSFKL